MKDSTRGCAGCGSPLPIQKRAGNPRKWCSDSCRVAAFGRRNPDYLERKARRARERAQEVEADKPPRPQCESCGRPLASRRESSRFCTGEACQRAKRAADALTAPTCSIMGCDRPQQARTLCGSHYALEWSRRNPERSAAGKARYRARKRDAFVEDIDHSEVMERDRWTCGICGERIPKRAVYPHPRSASVDHILPLNAGGLHEMKNVQAAHLLCNALKSDRGGGEQLLLLG